MKQPLTAGVLTLFGITGDLAARYLLPAVYQLIADDLLPDNFIIVGLSRRDAGLDELIANLRKRLVAKNGSCDEAVLSKLAGLITLMKMDYANPDDYLRLKAELDKHEELMNVCLNRLFYLSIPAAAFGDIIDGLGAADLNHGCQHHTSDSRLLIEKPFGSDLASAEALIARIGRTFTDEQVYRIDHYLAKETAQNIMVFRFQNPLFRAIWDGALIDHITVTAAESLGVEGRSDFYDQTGALRDLLQSHLLQLLALVTMDEPKDMSAAAIHESKSAILALIKPPLARDMAQGVIRGQYQGYREETGNEDSTIETYVAARFTIDHERWHDTPLFIRTGKALAEKVTEITISFRQSSNPMVDANSLTIRIQPNEGIVLSLLAKKPGLSNETERVQMDFCYDHAFDTVQPDAYERVLADAFRGDQTLFATSGEVLATWRIVQPILDAWRTSDVAPEAYDKGSWGPESANKLVARDQAAWPDSTLKICTVHPEHQ